MKHIARKRFGQHFLVDAAIIESIVSAIDPRPHQALVEIGPGLGALTLDRKSTRLNSSHIPLARMPSSG